MSTGSGTALVAPAVAPAATPTMADRITDVTAVGKAFFLSGLFGCTNESQGLVLALASAAENKNPLVIARENHITNRGLVMKSDVMLAKFRMAGGEYKWLNPGHNGEARIKMSYRGNELEFSFTRDEAKAAGLYKNSTWQHYEQDMLCARAVARGVRKIAPEVCYGFSTPEELDIDPHVVNVAETNGNGNGSGNGSTKVVDVETLMRQAATTANGGANGNHAAPSVIDAKAEQVAEPASTTTPAQASTNGEHRPANTMPCTLTQRDKIEALFGQLGADEATREAILKKRGVSVTRSLTVAQAEQLINVLQYKADEIQAAAATPATEPVSAPASEPDLATEVQVAAIKQLLAELNDPDLFLRVKKCLADAGLQRLTEMTWHDATRLEAALQQRNIEKFFERALAKPVATQATKAG